MQRVILKFQSLKLKYSRSGTIEHLKAQDQEFRRRCQLLEDQAASHLFRYKSLTDVHPDSYNQPPLLLIKQKKSSFNASKIKKHTSLAKITTRFKLQSKAQISNKSKGQSQQAEQFKYKGYLIQPPEKQTQLRRYGHLHKQRQRFNIHQEITQLLRPRPSLKQFQGQLQELQRLSSPQVCQFKLPKRKLKSIKFERPVRNIQRKPIPLQEYFFYKLYIPLNIISSLAVNSRTPASFPIQQLHFFGERTLILINTRTLNFIKLQSVTNSRSGLVWVEDQGASSIRPVLIWQLRHAINRLEESASDEIHYLAIYDQDDVMSLQQDFFMCQDYKVYKHDDYKQTIRQFFQRLLKGRAFQSFQREQIEQPLTTRTINQLRLLRASLSGKSFFIVDKHDFHNQFRLNFLLDS